MAMSKTARADAAGNGKETSHMISPYPDSPGFKEPTTSKAAGNSILERFTASIRQLGQVSRGRTVHIQGVTQQSVQDHTRIVEALKARDPHREIRPRCRPRHKDAGATRFGVQAPPRTHRAVTSSPQD